MVTVKSQLGARAQLEAAAAFGVDDDHNGILSNSCALALVRRVLSPEEPALHWRYCAGGAGEVSPPDGI